jgi:hypothetical protein
MLLTIQSEFRFPLQICLQRYSFYEKQSELLSHMYIGLAGTAVSNPAGDWCECCMLSDGGLCDELITRPEESYRLWYVLCVIENPQKMRKPWPALGCRATVGGGGDVFIALVIQHKMCRTILSYVACPALTYFPTLPQKWHEFRKEIFLKTKCVFIPSTTFVRKSSHSKKNSTRYHKCLLVFM